MMTMTRVECRMKRLKMPETDDVNETSNTQGTGKEITAGPWTFTPLPVRQQQDDQEKPYIVNCVWNPSFINLD